MKFHNGCWLLKEGVGGFSPRQVYEARISEREVVLCVPTFYIRTKGDTLGGIVLTIRITSPAEEILRMQVWHHKGVQKREPEFELELREELPLEAEETAEEIIVRSGHLSLTVNKNSCAMRYERDGKLLTRLNSGDLVYVKENWRGTAYDKGTGAHMCAQLGLSVKELIYGLGERFSAFVKNGQSVSI